MRSFILFLILVGMPVLLASEVKSTSTASRFTLEAPSAGDPMLDALPPAKPWVPGWCRWDWRAGWMGQHEGFVSMSKSNSGKVDVVFYGDSITQGWGDGVKSIDEKKNIVNCGIGGDSTRQILWRASHGELDAITPKLIVLAIGTNNLYDDANSGTDEEIAQGIGACVSLLKSKVSSANILVCAILPRQNDWFCGRAKHINEMTAKLDNGRDIRVLNMWDVFYSANCANRVKEELYRKDDGSMDSLHLGSAGYVTWAEQLTPWFTKFLL